VSKAPTNDWSAAESSPSQGLPRQQLVAPFWSGCAAASGAVLHYAQIKGPISLFCT